MMAWLIAIPLLGLVNGMRTMTPIAVLCWFAYAGYLPVGGTWAFWSAKLVVAIVFTVLALAEFVGDKLPKTPNRTAIGPLIARLLFGGLVAAIVAVALNGSGLEAVILGAAGVLIGAFASFVVRRDLVARSGSKDWPVAVIEDISAVVLAIFAMGIITG
jgi:uncharacterized membrane protein